MAAADNYIVISRVRSRNPKRRTKKCGLDMRGQACSQGGLKGVFEHVHKGRERNAEGKTGMKIVALKDRLMANAVERLTKDCVIKTKFDGNVV